MAGHSKWSNIKRRKGAQDAKRGKIFMVHAKEIYTAAKEGGGDPDMNAALRLAIDRARAVNMPNDNIDRSIKKATGSLDGVKYEEVTYEGYGPGGVAVMVQVLTDNRNRTAAEIRHAFSKNGGNLGESGCVAFMFERKGYIVILDKDGRIDEDELTMEVLELGAEDLEIENNVFEIFTTPEAFHDVSTQLRETGYTPEEAEVTYIPQNHNALSPYDEEKMLKLVDMLEEKEDVQDVHHNLELS